MPIVLESVSCNLDSHLEGEDNNEDEVCILKELLQLFRFVITIDA